MAAKTIKGIMKNRQSCKALPIRVYLYEIGEKTIKVFESAVAILGRRHCCSCIRGGIANFKFFFVNFSVHTGI